jgi:uncharacterized protein (TIGR03437 family)
MRIRIVLVLLVVCLVSTGSAQKFTITKMSSTAGQPGWVEVAPDGTVWAIGMTNFPTATATVFKGNLQQKSFGVVGTAPLPSTSVGLLNKQIYLGAVHSPQIAAQNGNQYRFGVRVFAMVGNTSNNTVTGSVTTPEFLADATKGTLTQVCKSYTLEGKKLPEGTLVLGSDFAAGEPEYLVTPVKAAGGRLTNGPSAIYARKSVDANGVCDLKLLLETGVPLIQALPRGVIERLESADSQNRTVSSVGTLKGMWVSPIASPSPLRVSASTPGNNTTLLCDEGKQMCFVSYLAPQVGGMGIIVDKNDGVIEAYSNKEDGSCSTHIVATSFHYPWVVLNCGTTSALFSNKQVVKNVVTGVKYTSNDLVTELPEGYKISFADGVERGSVTSQGTFLVLATNGNQSDWFAVDIPGVTGFLKPVTTLTANPPSIKQGGKSQLAYTCQGCDYYSTIDNGVGSVSSASGIIEVSPVETTTYTLAAGGLGGSNAASTTVTVEKPSAPLPTFTADSVVNAASFKAPIVTGSIATIYGINLAAGTAENKNLTPPTTLINTRVFVSGIAAPLYFVSPEQINFQVPFEATGATATILVTTASGESKVITVPLAKSAPGLFLGENGNVIAQNASDYSIITFGNPATGEDVVVVYGTGNGPTACDIKTGEPSPLKLCPTLEVPKIMIGEQEATVLYSGLTPGFVGLYQTNFIVPGKRPSDMGNTLIYPTTITVETGKQKSDAPAFIPIAQ